MKKLSKLLFNTSLLSFIFIYPVHSYAKALSVEEIRHHLDLSQKAVKQRDFAKARQNLEVIANSEINSENRRLVGVVQHQLGKIYLEDKKRAKKGVFLLKEACKNYNEESCNRLKELGQ